MSCSWTHWIYSSGKTEKKYRNRAKRIKESRNISTVIEDFKCITVVWSFPTSILIGQHHLLDEIQNNNLWDDCFYQNRVHLSKFTRFVFSYLVFFLQPTISTSAGCSAGTETWASAWSERWTSSGPPNSSRASWTTGRHKKPTLNSFKNFPWYHWLASTWLEE